MGTARTLILSFLLAGVGIALASWGPGAGHGYVDDSIGLLGGAMIGAALAFLASERGWWRQRPSR